MYALLGTLPTKLFAHFSNGPTSFLVLIFTISFFVFVWLGRNWGFYHLNKASSPIFTIS
jgi:hypothetical protein